MAYRYRVPVIHHPCQTFVHNVQGTITFLIANLSDLQQNILRRGCHGGFQNFSLVQITSLVKPAKICNFLK